MSTLTASQLTNFKSVLRKALLVPLLVLALAPLALFFSIHRLLDVVQFKQNTIEVLYEMSQIQARLVDMETGLRGFQLTRDAQFLQPYYDAGKLIDQESQRMETLVSSHEDQADRFAEFQETRLQWQTYAWEIIRKTNNGSPFVASDVSQGKEIMDRLRVLLGSLSGTEKQFLGVRREKSSQAEVQVLTSIVIIFSGVAVIVGWWVVEQISLLQRSYENVVRQIQEQKEWFQVTLSSIGDAVMVTDHDGKVRFMNSEAERMTGWEFADAEAKQLRAIFHIINEETRLTVDDPVEKVFKEKRVVGLANHTLLISKKGAEWPIEDSASPIFDNEKDILGVVLVFHDATEMRKAQRLMKTHAEELERKVLERTLELHRTVGELQAFSYSVSHDLRAPLRTMQGFANTLLEDYSEKLDATGQDYLRRIRKAAERLDHLVQDVLTYSRISETETSIKTVNLDVLVGEVIQQYPGIKDHESRITVRSPLHSVLGHEAGLTQIVSNLLVNAVKFAASERELRIVIRTEPREKTVLLWIEDNGIGIPSDYHARIFRIFEQIDPKVGGGTGIGLAIVQKAAEKMHGTVGVNSVPGQGSEFWVELIKPAYAA